MSSTFQGGEPPTTSPTAPLTVPTPKPGALIKLPQIRPKRVASAPSQLARQSAPPCPSKTLSPSSTPSAPNRQAVNRRPTRSFFCLWIPHFPAWVTAQTDPKLRARAFVVCDRGTVIAPSPLALQAGITAGMSSGRAQSTCTSVVIVTRDRTKEELAWHEIQRSSYGLTPKVEPLAPGLLFADLEGRKALPLVSLWGARGGTGSDRASAHLAALTAAPGAMRGVRPGDEEICADRVSLKDLVPAGLSPKTVEKLRWMGKHSVGDVRVFSRRQLEEQYQPDGLFLYRLAQGPRDEANLRPVPTWTPPDEIATSLSFELPCTEPGEWELALTHLLVDACRRLGTMSTHAIEVIADTSIGPVASRRLLKEPISKAAMLERPARSALSEALQVLLPLLPVLRGLEVRLSALICAPLQGSLWDETSQSNDPAVRSKRWNEALENVETRFKKPDGTPIVGRYLAAQPNSPFSEDHFLWMSAVQELDRQRKANGRQRKTTSKAAATVTSKDLNKGGAMR